MLHQRVEELVHHAFARNIAPPIRLRHGVLVLAMGQQACLIGIMPRVGLADKLPLAVLVKLWLDPNSTPVDRQVQKVEE